VGNDITPWSGDRHVNPQMTVVGRHSRNVWREMVDSDMNRARGIAVAIAVHRINATSPA
jgi:hypothetical protein